jgi:hypothetical protein
MKNQKGFLDLTLILALVIIIAVGGFVWWRVSNADEPTVADSTLKTTKTDTTEEVETTIPEGWFEYVNDDFGYIVALPDKYQNALTGISSNTIFEGLGDPIILSLEKEAVPEKTAFDGDSLKIWAFKINDFISGDEKNVVSNALEDSFMALVELNRTINANNNNPNLDVSVGELQNLSIIGGQAYYYEISGGYDYKFTTDSVNGWVLDEPAIVGFLSNGEDILFFTYSVSDVLASQILKTFMFL